MLSRSLSKTELILPKRIPVRFSQNFFRHIKQNMDLHKLKKNQRSMWFRDALHKLISAHKTLPASEVNTILLSYTPIVEFKDPVIVNLDSASHKLLIDYMAPLFDQEPKITDFFTRILFVAACRVLTQDGVDYTLPISTVEKARKK